MTSKEALETLFDLLCEREHTNSEHNFWLKLYQSVKEDLEVLEILKNYLEVKSLDLAIEDIFLKGKDIIIVNCEKENDFYKIKGWLENGK